MSDRVRGALFNRLGDIEELTVLDAFAGSGALSFEAASRGAASVLAIEIDKSAQTSIARGIKELELQQRVKLVKANSSGWSNNNAEEQFDIVIAAPPYDDLQLPLIQKLVRHVKKSGIFVLDWPGNLTVPELQSLELISAHSYGDAQLGFYRYAE
jgi:16S rRNA (guanine966-N2)-methyltransferase